MEGERNTVTVVQNLQLAVNGLFEIFLLQMKKQSNW